MVPLESYPHVKQDCTLREALDTLSNSNIKMRGETSLPRILLVFDDQEVLVGLVRRRDILHGLSPRWLFKADNDHPEAMFGGGIDQNIGDVLADKAVSSVLERSSVTIEQYVQPIAGVVQADHSLIRLVNVMVQQGYHMLPVVVDGRAIGVVRSVEVMWAVRELLQNHQVQTDD